jgi:hypothetical protein
MKDFEHQHQAAIFEWARWQQAANPVLALLYAVPNGGHRHPAVAAKLKAEGVKSGVPDMCLPVARGDYHGLYIELKAGKNKATKTQAEWLQALTVQGYRAECVTGSQAAIDLISEYLGL